MNGSTSASGVKVWFDNESFTNCDVSFAVSRFELCGLTYHIFHMWNIDEVTFAADTLVT